MSVQRIKHRQKSGNCVSFKSVDTPCLWCNGLIFFFYFKFLVAVSCAFVQLWHACSMFRCLVLLQCCCQVCSVWFSKCTQWAKNKTSDPCGLLLLTLNWCNSFFHYSRLQPRYRAWEQVHPCVRLEAKVIMWRWAGKGAWRVKFEMCVSLLNRWLTEKLACMGYHGAVVLCDVLSLWLPIWMHLVVQGAADGISLNAAGFPIILSTNILQPWKQKLFLDVASLPK